jgi:alkylhydroperoxidase family enzyme
VRFNSAREAGLSEDKANDIVDGYEHRLSTRESAALKLTDALITHPRLSDEDRRLLAEQFSEEEIAELALGIGLFLGMSKVLITLGLEPDEMATTIVPTPGSQLR